MNVLIIEDEALAARRLARMTREILGPACESLTIKVSVDEAGTHLQSHPVQLVLLDLNLNGASGFDLFKRLAAGSFHTIIVSASLDQAVTAFDHGVLDFVPKPFSKERLEKAFERLSSARAAHAPGMKYLSVKNYGEIRLIPLENVRFFKGADDYVEIHLNDNSLELYGKSMDALMQLLPSPYCRIHKSYIVDLSKAMALHIQGGGKYEVELLDGMKLPVSRMQYPVIQERLGRQKG
jgi:two-component system, LytTR family, response regulator LytT